MELHAKNFTDNQSTDDRLELASIFNAFKSNYSSKTQQDDENEKLNNEFSSAWEKEKGTGTLLDNYVSSKTHTKDNDQTLTPVIPGSGGALIFVIVSFIVLMLITIAWLLSYYIQRFRQLRMTTRVHRRRQQLAKRAIAQIPTRILESIHSDDDEDGNEKTVLEGGFDYRIKT